MPDPGIVKTKMLAIVLLFSACGGLDEMDAELPSDEEQENFAIEILNGIQQRTFDADREFCGHLAVNSAGETVATEPTMGELDSCFAADPDPSLTLFGSYHSHGAFDPEVDSEVPSAIDLKADVAERVDGFIGTPGGRVWVNDFEDQTAYLICEGCIQSDPRFESGFFPRVEESYTIEQLESRFAR